MQQSAQTKLLPFIITIDTEGDNEWAKPQKPLDKNAAYLPRFQSLCEKYQLQPTYLVDHTMAMSPVFKKFGQDIIDRNVAEIGMHLHPWNSPPDIPITQQDHQHQPYLTAYPENVMRAKIKYQTDILEQIFQTKMLSHRAGRFGFDERYARILEEHGYIVDCSVTPHVSWENNNDIYGGPDFSKCQETPYWLDLENIRKPGKSSLLEVPVTIANRWPRYLKPPKPGQRTVKHLPKRIMNRIYPALVWMYPRRTNRKMLQWIVHKAVTHPQTTHLEFFLHSSELMPAGSPWLQNQEDIERLYSRIEPLFDLVSQHCQSMTLKQFHDYWADLNPPGE